MKIMGIYKIENKLNSKKYIGQSVDIKTRFRKHRYLMGKKNHPLYDSMVKYGLENFTFEIIEECKEKDLDKREIYWMKYYDVLKTGYNLTYGGNKNRRFTKKHRENLSKAHKGQQWTESQREKIIHNSPLSMRVRCVTDNKVFASLRRCGIYYGTYGATISYVIKNNKEWNGLSFERISDEEYKRDRII